MGYHQEWGREGFFMGYLLFWLPNLRATGVIWNWGYHCFILHFVIRVTTESRSSGGEGSTLRDSHHLDRLPCPPCPASPHLLKVQGLARVPLEESGYRCQYIAMAWYQWDPHLQWWCPMAGERLPMHRGASLPNYFLLVLTERLGYLIRGGYLCTVFHSQWVTSYLGELSTDDARLAQWRFSWRRPNFGLDELGDHNNLMSIYLVRPPSGNSFWFICVPVGLVSGSASGLVVDTKVRIT
eukprot:2031472-Amphidinium_carterae.1